VAHIFHHPPHHHPHDELLFRVNVVVTLLPALSVTSSVYVPFVEIIEPLPNGKLFSVAVTHERLSLNVIVMLLVYVVQLLIPKYCGKILSIRVTVAVVDHVFPTLSWYAKMKFQLSVKV